MSRHYLALSGTAGLMIAATAQADRISIPADCAVVHIDANGREVRSMARTGGGGSSARASGSSSTSSSSAVSVSSSSRGGGTARASSSVTDGSGRTITTTRDERGCTVTIDER